MEISTCYFYGNIRGIHVSFVRTGRARFIAVIPRVVLELNGIMFENTIPSKHSKY